jgi:hypothetical protein
MSRYPEIRLMKFASKCFCFLIPILCAVVGWSDVIVVKDQDPLYGVVVSSNEQNVTFRPWNADGTTRPQQTIERSEIVLLAVTIDSKRLQAAKKDPNLLYDYAEELSAMQKDPASLAAAKQLFQRLVQDEHGQIRVNALRSLFGMAQSTSERKQIAAMALIMEPGADTADFRIGDAANGPSDPKKIAELLHALRLLRSDQLLPAKEILKRPDIQQLDALVRSVCSIRTLLEFSSEANLGQDQLATVLLCERQLLLALIPGNVLDHPDNEAGTWSPVKFKAKAIHWPDFQQK